MLQKRANMDKKVADKVLQDVFLYGAFISDSIGAYDWFYSAAKAGSDEILKQGIDLSEFGHAAYTIGQGEFVTQDEIKMIRGYAKPKAEMVPA